MFNKLKKAASNAVGDALIQKISDQLTPILQEKLLSQIKQHTDALKDDSQFKEKVINPLYIVVSTSTGGLDKLMPSIQEKFTNILLSVKTQLINFDSAIPTLVTDAQERLPKIVLEGLKS